MRRVDYRLRFPSFFFPLKTALVFSSSRPISQQLFLLVVVQIAVLCLVDTRYETHNCRYSVAEKYAIPLVLNHLRLAVFFF